MSTPKLSRKDTNRNDSDDPEIAEQISDPAKNHAKFSVSLKEWRIFHAVVNYGTYASAAEYLHISQPAISYTLAKLEDQLGIPLFRLEGRKAQVTVPGSELLERSRTLLKVASELEEFAKNLKKNWRPEIKLAVKKDFPTGLLLKALRTFSQHQQSAKVILIEGSGTKIEQALQDHIADLAINSRVPTGFQGNLLIEMELVPVARSDHPLFKLDRELGAADMERELQVIAHSEGPGVFDEKCLRTEGRQIWFVNNFDTAQSVVSEGLGYGWLPWHKIQGLLGSGHLKVLPLQQPARCKSAFYLIHGRSSIPTAEARRLELVLKSVAAAAETLEH